MPFVEDGVEHVITCSWLDEARTLCSNPKCAAQVPIDELLRMGYTFDHLVRELARKAAGK